MAAYHCFYFGTGGGRSPVEEFIDGMDEAAQRKFVYKRSLLESLGPRLLEPHAKNLGGGIFELRFSGKDSDFRLLYFFGGDKVIFTSAFKKKSQKTPRNEIDLAAARRRLYLSSRSWR